jgi:hypothetical protein
MARAVPAAVPGIWRACAALALAAAPAGAVTVRPVSLTAGMFDLALQGWPAGCAFSGSIIPSCQIVPLLGGSLRAGVAQGVDIQVGGYAPGIFALSLGIESETGLILSVDAGLVPFGPILLAGLGVEYHFPFGLAAGMRTAAGANVGFGANTGIGFMPYLGWPIQVGPVVAVPEAGLVVPVSILPTRSISTVVALVGLSLHLVARLW